VVVTAGLAEIAAGSIAMGLGGYLAAKSDAEHYASEHAREQREFVERVEDEIAEVEKVFQDYGLTREQIAPIVEALQQRPKDWVDFMMKFELGLEKPDPRRAIHSAFTIAGAYIAGGLIPLGPYIFLSSARAGMWVSTIVTLAALSLFGYIKGHFTGTRPVRNAIQTVITGGLAAAAAFGLALAIS